MTKNGLTVLYHGTKWPVLGHFDDLRVGAVLVFRVQHRYHPHLWREAVSCWDDTEKGEQLLELRQYMA